MWIEQDARKHGVTDEDMRHAITHRLHVSELPTDDETERVLIIGPNRAGNPWRWWPSWSRTGRWSSTPWHYEPATGPCSRGDHNYDHQALRFQQRSAGHR